MTDYLPDTPVLSRYYCPPCEPDADVLGEILETRYCGTHEPVREGRADDQVHTQSYMSGSAECGGWDNRMWCDALHRGIWPSGPRD